MPASPFGPFRWRRNRARALILLLGACAPIASAHAEDSPAKTKAVDLPGGFEAAGLLVDRSEIIAGGPGRDGIRSIDQPRFVVPADALRWVRDDNTVIGIAVGDDARAYPLHVLEHHQVVNDRIGNVGVLVTYDPLIDVARAWVTGPVEAGTEARQFGVSGLIYRCNFVLYERGADTLWSQYDGRALTGPEAGTQLERLVVRVEPLGVWRKRHPATLVMKPPADRRIDYRYSPYSSYWVSGKVPFPVEHADARIHPKEIVLGARVGDVARAYLASVVERRGGRVVDEIAGHRVRIEYDSDAGTFSWEAPEEVELTSAYWFAWKNFQPDTELWNVELEPDEAEAAAGTQGETPTGVTSGPQGRSDIDSAAEPGTGQP